MNPIPDPSALRRVARDLATLGDLIAADTDWPADADPLLWLGPGSAAYAAVRARLGDARRHIGIDLRNAVGVVAELAVSAEVAQASVSHWSARLTAAESVIAEDPAAIEIERQATVGIATAVEAFDREDRRAAFLLDSLLTRRPVIRLAEAAVALGSIVASDSMESELAALSRDARVAMTHHAEGRLTDGIARLERFRVYLRLLGVRGVDFAIIGRLRRHRDRLREWAASGRVFLAYSAESGGRVVEVLGPIDSARHIAVVVPGVTSSEYNFDERLRRAAADLQAADPTVAVVAWLGYDAPGGGPLGTGPIAWSALDTEVAQAGATELAAFVTWLREHRPDAHVTVIGHSYGSVVASIAAAEGLAVDDLVLVGSPGVPPTSVASLHLAPGARVWSGSAPWDPIDELSALAAIGGTSDADGDPQRLVHGANPTHASFGALQLDFTGSVGHSGYFDDNGISVLSAVVTGSHQPVNRGGAVRRRSSGGAPRTEAPASSGTR